MNSTLGKTSIFEVGKMAHSIADNITSTFEMFKFPLRSGWGRQSRLA